MATQWPQSEVPPLVTSFLNSPSGLLELCTAVPAIGKANNRPPVLFLHGTNCAAACYKVFLPLFAAKGFTAYALSLRGHGESYKMSWFWMMFLTTLDNFADDVVCAIDYIKENDGQAPVLVGHSFGGGVLQYLLASRGIRVPGLVLLASAPLSGGGTEIMENWAAAEAPDGYDWPWSRRYRLDTVAYAKSAFFSPDCPEDVVKQWLKESHPPCESTTAESSVLWPFGMAFGTAEDVLKAIDGLPGTGRKVLCIAGERDALVKKEMVDGNVKAYMAADNSGEAIQEAVVSRSGHHLMLDVARDECAKVIIKWLT